MHLPVNACTCNGMYRVTTVATRLNADVCAHWVHCAMYWVHGVPDWLRYVTSDTTCYIADNRVWLVGYNMLHRIPRATLLLTVTPMNVTCCNASSRDRQTYIVAI